MCPSVEMSWVLVNSSNDLMEVIEWRFMFTWLYRQGLRRKARGPGMTLGSAYKLISLPSKQTLWSLSSWIRWLGSQVTSGGSSQLSVSLTLSFSTCWAQRLTWMRLWEGIRVQVWTASWMADDGDWSSVSRQDSRKEWSSSLWAKRRSPNAKIIPPTWLAQGWTYSGIVAEEILTAWYICSMCSLCLIIRHISHMVTLNPECISPWELVWTEWIFPCWFTAPKRSFRSREHPFFIIPPWTLLACRVQHWKFSQPWVKVSSKSKTENLSCFVLFLWALKALILREHSSWYL